MAATFVVEDGSGKTNANSYLSIADADQYNLDHDANATWTGASDANKEKALRLATQYLDAMYGGRWKGVKTDEDQALDFPRTDSYDYSEYVYDDDVVPAPIEQACAELAILSIGGEDLLPDKTNPGAIKRKRVKADVVEQEIEYVGGNSPYKRFSMVENIIREMIYSNNMIRRA